MPYNNNSGNFFRPSGFGGFQLFPPVIKTLLLINGAVFVVTFFFGMFRIGDHHLANYLTLYGALMPLESGYFYPWQLITYQFMHADFWHLFFNMFLGLWMFGTEIEHILGSRKFLFFYLFCGVAAGVAQLVLMPILEPGTMAPVLGASGAVYGVMIAFAMYFPDRYIYVYFILPVKIKYFIGFLVLVGVLSVGGQSNIAHMAHLGGALAGFVFIYYEKRQSYRKSPFDQAQQWFDSIRQGSKTANYTDKMHDANVYEINDGSKRTKPPMSEREINQARIDEILDKISNSGYQSLSEEEKKILFEASKKLN
jgi:membrane associated rhomboid family serine protease